MHIWLQQWFGRSTDCFRTALRALVLLIGLPSLVTGSHALDNRADASTINQAAAKLARGDCNTAWNIVWPLAKDGNQDARNFLFASINTRMLPPGVTGDPASMYQHVLVLAAYVALIPPGQVLSGADSDRRFARIEVPGAISKLKLGPNGKRVTECYRTGSSFKYCLDLAVSLGVIPTFAEYATETERQQEETGVAATCLPSH